jgi:AcrR family transcriptional regulator
MPKDNKGIDSTTEEKVKQAARRIFIKKGYYGTRTRDIAEEAGINLALLNYYFRSKERLFEIIMFETMLAFMQQMSIVFNEESTSIKQKVEKMVDSYTELLLREPNIPLFIMSEIRNDATGFLEKLPVANMIMSSVLVKQYNEAYKNGQVKEANPLHFIINLMSIVIFPFIASPLLKKMGNMSDPMFKEFMLERKQIIPRLIGLSDK